MAKEKVIGECTLKMVRLSFANIFKPGDPMKGDDGEMQPGKYKANGLMHKTDTSAPDGEFTKINLEKLRAAKEEAMAKEWGPDPKNWPKLKPDQLCVRDGDMENWEGYADHFFVSANNKNQPVLVDRIKDAEGKWVPLTLANGGEKKLYSGAYVNMTVRLWAQRAKKLPNGSSISNRVNASIEAIQFVKHGKPFSGGAPVDPNDVFDEMPPDDMDEYGGGTEDDDDTGGVI